MEASPIPLSSVAGEGEDGTDALWASDGVVVMEYIPTVMK